MFHHIELYPASGRSTRSAGVLVEDEQFYNDDKTGPFTVAAYNMVMLLAVEGQQYTGRELTAMFAEVGFTDIDVKPTCGYWRIVTGRER